MKSFYTTKQKGAALALVDFLDGNVRRAANVLEISHTTLDEWVKGRHVSKESQEIRTDLKTDWIERLENMLLKLASGLEDEAKIAKARLSENSTAFGTIFDKRQLLLGKPTNISEDVTPTPEQLAEIRKLKAERGEESISDNN